MKPVFIGAIGVITANLDEGRSLFVESLGLPLRRARGAEFWHTEKLEGSRYFGVWPLSEAARVCFGTEAWPSGRPVPQAFIEFEMASRAAVKAAAAELEAKGHALLHPARTDPWGQTVARLQTPEGLVLGVSFVPWMHRAKRTVPAPSRTRRRANP